MVDTLVLGASALRHGGSSPLIRTKSRENASLLGANHRQTFGFSRAMSMLVALIVYATCRCYIKWLAKKV